MEEIKKRLLDANPFSKVAPSATVTNPWSCYLLVPVLVVSVIVYIIVLIHGYATQVVTSSALNQYNSGCTSLGSLVLGGSAGAFPQGILVRASPTGSNELYANNPLLPRRLVSSTESLALQICRGASNFIEFSAQVAFRYKSSRGYSGETRRSNIDADGTLYTVCSYREYFDAARIYFGIVLEVINRGGGDYLVKLETSCESSFISSIVLMHGFLFYGDGCGSVKWVPLTVRVSSYTPNTQQLTTGGEGINFALATSSFLYFATDTSLVKTSHSLAGLNQIQSCSVTTTSHPIRAFVFLSDAVGVLLDDDVYMYFVDLSSMSLTAKLQVSYSNGTKLLPGLMVCGSNVAYLTSVDDLPVLRQVTGGTLSPQISATAAVLSQDPSMKAFLTGFVGCTGYVVLTGVVEHHLVRVDLSEMRVEGTLVLDHPLIDFFYNCPGTGACHSNQIQFSADGNFAYLMDVAAQDYALQIPLSTGWASLTHGSSGWIQRFVLQGSPLGNQQTPPGPSNLVTLLLQVTQALDGTSSSSLSSTSSTIADIIPCDIYSICLRWNLADTQVNVVNSRSYTIAAAIGTVGGFVSTVVAILTYGNLVLQKVYDRSRGEENVHKVHPSPDELGKGSNLEVN